jgi:delta14-sterol reductase
MDITTDGFGFMLAFGDLLFVPFTYGLQARYLAFHPIDLGYTAIALILVVKGLGAWAFKGANTEKFDFRNGRNPKSGFDRASLRD